MRRGLVALAASITLGLVNGPAGDARAAARQGEPAAQPVLEVALPDVSRLHPSVQRQLREAHASLLAEARRPDASPPARADAFGDMGTLFLVMQFNDAAERCYRNAQRLASEDFRWPYYLAHVLRDTGDLSAAAESFERARALRSTDLATLVWLGRVYLDLARPDAAESPLTAALSLYPNHPAVRFELGRAAVEQQDYARAVEQLTTALTLDPEATVVHYPLAMAYRGLGDLDNAAHHVERRGGRGRRGYTAAVAFKLPDPLMAALNAVVVQAPQFYRDRALDAAAAENWPEAVANYRRVVEADPDDADMRVNLGTASKRAGDARGALAQYEEALRLNPRLADAHYGLGDLLERGGRDQEAIERYTAAVTEDPTFDTARLRLADALRRTDRPEPALSQYQQVIARTPAHAGARFGEAMALVRLERYAAARERLTEAMTVRPDQSMFRLALARVLAAAPDDQVRDGARAWALVKALPEEQQHPAVFETMAMALAELGHFDLAIDWQRIAMSAAARAWRSDSAQRMAANLALYTRRQPCRTPWRNDDPDHRPGPPVDPGLLDPPASR